MTYCNIRFRVKFHTEFNESIRLLGNHEQLGHWRPSFGLPLITNPQIYPIWESEFAIKAPTGFKLEFKAAVFCDGKLIRWESLPNNENRYYRVRYYCVLVEISEAVLYISETIEKKFVSSKSLTNLENFKRVKKSKQIFNPFENAQNSYSSESWDTSSLGKFSSDDYSSPPNGDGQVFLSDDEITTDTRRIEDEKAFAIKDAPDLQKDLNRDIEGDIVIKNYQHKRKVTLKPTEFSNLDRVLQAINDKKPDIFSVLYQKYRNEEGISRRQPITIGNTESYSDLLQYDLEDEMVQFLNDEPVIMVSFKLPITVSLIDPNEKAICRQWKVVEDTNTHLGTLFQFRKEKLKGMLWIGWVGIYVDNKYRRELTSYLYKEYSCIPIFLEEQMCKSFLFEYCNNFLHSAFFGLLNAEAISSQEDYIQVYNNVNQIFATKVLEYADRRSLILLHDYHLMMVPKYISQKDQKLTISFSFDTPFPGSDIMKAFYNKKELVESLLCSDLVCFTSNEYMRSFSNICTESLGIQISSEKGGHLYLAMGGRKIYVKTAYPCLDFQSLTDLRALANYQKARNAVEEKYQKKNLLLGFNSFTKYEGIEQLLQSMKVFFELYRDQQYCFCIAECEDIYRLDDQERHKKEYVNKVKEVINTINQELGQKGLGSSIELMENVLSREEKLAMMELSHLLIAFSPYIENNINVLEYLFVKSEDNYNRKDANTQNPLETNQKAGILLNEFSDCSKHLITPTKVNPFSKNSILDGIKKTLDRNSQMTEFLVDTDRAVVMSYSIWDRFYDILLDNRRAHNIKSRLNLMPIEENGEFKVISVTNGFQPLEMQSIAKAFKEAKRKVIICSYENTLVDDGLYNNLQLCCLQTKGLEIIRKLCSDPDIAFYVVSDKKVDVLAGAFEDVERVSLLAENGFFYKMSYESNWYNMYECDWSWQSIVQRIMQSYASRIGGAKVESKESSILWNCKDMNDEIIKVQQKELVSHLSTVLAHVENVQIIKGRASVEVKATGVNKGVVTELIMNREKLVKGEYPGFVLCIGATNKDEEMFGRINKLLKEDAEFQKVQSFNCTVGKKQSNAKFYVENIQGVYQTLNTLAN